MPTIVVGAALAGAFAGVTVTAGVITGFSWAAAAWAFGSSLVLGGLSKAMQKTPDSAGQASAFSQSGRNVTVRQPIAPGRVIYGEDQVGGVVTFKQVTDTNQYYHLIVTFAWHECQEIVEIYLDDEAVGVIDADCLVRHGRWYNPENGDTYLRIQKSLGDEAGQPFPALVDVSAGQWTDAHRQTGRTKIYFRFKFNADVYPNGIPNIRAVIKGKKDIYDPRTATTGYTNNWALCVADYLTDPTIGFGADYATEIDEAELIASANISDEMLTEVTGVLAPRYTVNGTFQLSEKPGEIIAKMLTAAAGRATFIGGTWRVLAGAYITPTVTLDEGDLAGAIRMQTMVSRRENANGVKGVYVEPSAGWQPIEFPPLASSTYLAEDNNERVWKDLDLSGFVRSGAQAQRLSKIELLRGRQGITVEYPCKLTGYLVQPGNTVMINNTKYGWSGKVFEVTKGVFSINSEGALGYVLSLRETASALFDWNVSEEQPIDVAPNTNLPDPFAVAPPGNPAIEEVQYELRDRVAVKAVVSWAASPDPFVTGYRLEYREVGDTAWIVLPPNPSTSVELLDFKPGRYDFRVKAINSLGSSSVYAQTLDKEIVGLLARPAAPVIRGLQAAGGLAILTLDPHPDLDVRKGGRWRIRHSEDTFAPTWETSFSIGEEQGYVGGQTLLVLPLKGGSYLVKAQDSSGQQSEDFAVITTKQASVLSFTPIDVVQENPTFSGTNSNTVSVSSTLQLDTTGEFDDITDLDAVGSLDNIGGIVASGTYGFATGFDFGIVTRARLIGHITGLADNVNDQIDDRTGMVDSWLDFDGPAGGGSVDAYLEMRETDDDPTGSPTWSDWKRLDSAEVECWGAEFRLQIKSYDAAYNLLISELSVVADEVL